MQGGTVAIAADAHQVFEARSASVTQTATVTRPAAPAELIVSTARPVERPRPAMVVKIVADRVLASLALLVLAPVLLGLALAIRLSSSGPALFRQRRVGRHGEVFTMLKFRSMRIGAESELTDLLAHNESDGGVLFKIREDPRVTAVGHWMRRTSLDELPQLINVVTGSMSLVGPRPPLPDEVAAYPADAHRRMAVRPGLTGLWQISGRSDLSWEDSLRLDLSYVDDWSLGLDTAVLFKTFGAVLRAEGAY